jgi:hypothetical protein
MQSLFPFVLIAGAYIYFSCQGRRLIHALPFVLWLTFLTFSAVSSPAFQAFSCEAFSDGSSFLMVDYSVRCNSTEHLNVLKLAITIIVLYPVGVPLLYLLLLFSSRRTALSAHLGFLTDNYHQRFFFWELVETARRLLLGAFFALPFMGPGTFVQLITALAAAMGFLILQLLVRPFRMQSDNLFAFFASTALVVSLLCCVAIECSELSHDTLPAMPAALRSRFALDRPLIYGCLLMSNNSVIVAFLFICGRAVYLTLREARLGATSVGDPPKPSALSRPLMRSTDDEYPMDCSDAADTMADTATKPPAGGAPVPPGAQSSMGCATGTAGAASSDMC